MKRMHDGRWPAQGEEDGGTEAGAVEHSAYAGAGIMAERERWLAQWMEDGRRIGLAAGAVTLLARKLAELGLRPGQAIAPQAGEEEIRQLAEEWRASAYRESDAAMKQAEEEGR